MPLEFEEVELEYLDDALGIWLDGYEDATSAVHADRTFDHPEQYLAAVTGMVSHFDLATRVRLKVQAERRKHGNNASTI